ncbi:MAG TPA: tetratricopeptide repeat protein [Nitrospirota bacterium]|nr:tetratricopeptide repeat protein [Nitrospirota bacterium]
MSFIKYSILVVSLATMSACTGGKAVLPTSSANLTSCPSEQLAKSATIMESEQAQCLRQAIEAMNMGKTDDALMILRRITEQYPNTPWHQRALFLSERVLIQMDKPDEADAMMLRIQTEYHSLADYAIFILAEYHYAHTRYTQATALLQEVMKRFPKSSLVPRSLLLQGQALLEANAYIEAEDVFERTLQGYPQSDIAPAAGLGLGRSLQGQERFSEAIRAYQEVQVDYAGNSVEQDAEKELAALMAANIDIPALSADDLYKRGKNFLRSNQYNKAMESFSKLLQIKPPSPRESEVQMLSGIAAYNMGKRSEAAAILEKMLKLHPTDQRVPEALVWLGKSYSKLGEWEKAIRAFKKIVDRFPESEWADDALYFTGNIYRDAGDLKKSLESYRRLVDEYPQSNFADSALWWKAWASYTGGDYEKAKQSLQVLVARYPKSFLVNQARYWQGRAAEKLGDIPQAAAYYQEVLRRGPYTFYGYRAAESLASHGYFQTEVSSAFSMDSAVLCSESPCQKNQPRSADMDDGQPIWTDETRALLAAEPSFNKTLELMYVDMKNEAAIELWSLQGKIQHQRGALIGLSKAFFELGDYYRSLMLVLKRYERYLEAPKEDMPEDLWRLAYPQAYWERIITYARRYNQDPYFIAAIMREESQFKIDALSPAGARGLMQVMPATGARVAQQIKILGFNGSKLYDVDIGINIGTWYVGYLMKQFKGDYLFVAAAYNAGPEAVASWIKKNKDNRDRDVFVESIPFMETRGYVKKVLRNYAEYKRIYGAPIAAVQTAPLFPVDIVAPGTAYEKIMSP